jgi:hypothetical protein
LPVTREKSVSFFEADVAIQIGTAPVTVILLAAEFES